MIGGRAVRAGVAHDVRLGHHLRVRLGRIGKPDIQHQRREAIGHEFTEAILTESLRRLKTLKQPSEWCDAALRSLTPIPASEYPLPARRPAFSLLSNDKIARVFGISLPDWREQLRFALEDFDFQP